MAPPQAEPAAGPAAPPAQRTTTAPPAPERDTPAPARDAPSSAREAPAPSGTMPAIVFHAHGGPDRLCLEDQPIPAPAAHEALVRVEAVALNGFDPMVLRGLPTLPTPLPMIPCADGAGTIAALGADVDQARWRVGQRVGIVPLRPGRGVAGETLLGLARQYVAVPQAALLALPDAVGAVEAAALPTAYGTALRMLRDRGRVRPGERVLVLGAAGGVGAACVQLAALEGAEVIACADSDEALAKLASAGAAATIHTGREDVLAAVLSRYGKPSLWGGGGVEVVVNFLGGDTFAPSLACLARGGRLLTCGASIGPQVAIDLRYVWSFEIEIVGANGWSADDQADLIAMVAQGRLAPLIHAVRPLSACREAFEELIDRRVTGKSILLP